jgi:hypothetical protein
VIEVGTTLIKALSRQRNVKPGVLQGMAKAKE